MKRIGLLVLVMSMLCAAVVMIPARLIIPEGHYLTMRRIAMIESVRGTLWSGQMLLRTKQANIPVLVNWKTSGACLFVLKACVQIDLRTSGQEGLTSQFFAKLDVPLLSVISNSSCLPLGAARISKVSGTLSSDVLSAFIPELIAAEQSIAIASMMLDLDFASGVVNEAAGSIAIGAGAVDYRAPNGRDVTTTVEALSGSISDESGGYSLALRNKSGDVFFSVNTPKSRDEFRVVVYDAFTRAFGAGPFSSPGQNQARFEVSQKISDLLCSE